MISIARTTLLVAATMLLAGQASSSAVITSDISSGNAAAPASTIVLRSRITSNTTGQNPGAYALQIRFDDRSIDRASLKLLSSGLGPASLGPVSGSGADTTVTVASIGDITNTNPTPQLFTLEMKTLANPLFPYTMEVRDSGSNSLLSTSLASMPHTFDNSTLRNICGATCLALVADALLARETSTLAGDFNGDGMVDAADFIGR